MDGVLESHSGEVYRFDLVDEMHNPGGCDLRVYVLRHLPDDALDRLATVIGRFIPPAWPDWLPIWRFPDDATQAAVENQADAILDEAGPDQWVVTAGGLSSTTPFVAVRPATSTPLRT
jgi:hypothetical protein